MIPLLASLDELGFPTMRYLLSALWQSSLLFAATFALSYLLRRRRAAVRHALWALALLMAPFLPLLTRGFERAGAPQVRLTMLPAYHNDEVRMMKDEGGRMKDEVRRMKDKGGRMKDEWRQNTSGALPSGAETGLETMPRQEMRSVFDYPWALGLIAYIVGLSLFLIWIVLGRLRIRQWIGAAAPATDDGVLAAFRQAREALRFRRTCLVLQSPRVPVPISVGILRSRVLLPSALAPRLSDEELRAVALHETAHLSRRDPLVLTLAALVRAALFFHPLVWLAARQVSALAEHCADDAVLDATGRPLPYAELLARLAEELPPRPFAAEMAMGILLSKGAFLRRVEAILGDRDRARRLTRRALAATAAAVLLSIAVALAIPLGERTSGSIQALAEGDIQERGKAAESLVREVKEGKMDRDRAMRISQVLIPHLQRMADREETQGASSLGISHGELQLAWELVTREQVPRKQSVTMFSLLDTPWCQYISRDPARFELHGNLKTPPRGIIIQRLIWAKAVDGPTTKQRILESFIAARGDGITWGEESLVDLHPLTSQSLSIEMETTLYNAPPAVVERLPYRATKPAEFDEFKAAVNDGSSKKLCEYSASAQLSEGNRWRHRFKEPRSSDEIRQSEREFGGKDAEPAVTALVKAGEDAAQKKADTAESLSAWGEAVEGVQVRLKAEKKIWQNGETPRLQADILNQGTREWSVAQAQELCEVEVDSAWYRWGGEIRVKGSALPPNRQYNDIAIVLDSPWRRKDNDAELSLTKGPHKIRALFRLNPIGAWAGQNPSVISNPVEIEVVGAAQNEAQRSANTANATSNHIQDLIQALTHAQGGFVEHMTTITADTPETRELASIGKPAVPALIEALQHPDKNVRRHAAYTLGKIGDPSAAEPLLELCRAEFKRIAETGEYDNDVLEPAVTSYMKLKYPGRAADPRWVTTRAGMIYVLTGDRYMFEWKRDKDLEEFWKQYRRERPTVFTGLEDLDEGFRRAILDAAWKALPENLRKSYEKQIQDSPEREPYIPMEAVCFKAPNFHNQYGDSDKWRQVAGLFLSDAELKEFQARRETLFDGIAKQGVAVVPQLLQAARPSSTISPRIGYAREILKRIGPAAVPQLEKMLQTPRLYAPLVVRQLMAAASPPDIAWGEAVDGIRCALAPLRSSFTAGEDIALDLVYLNVSNKPITVCVYPDPFFIWTFLQIKNERGQSVARGPHANGLRRGLILSDFVTLAPGETASVRYDLPRGRMGRPQLEPGTYFASVELSKINRMEKYLRGYEALCRENGLKPWTGLIGSGPAKLTIVPMPEIAWGETVEGLQVGVGAPEITPTSITLSMFLRNTRNDDKYGFAGANFDLEMDGRPYAHCQWAIMNGSQETVYPGQIRGPIRLLLSDYVAEADRENPGTAPRPLANLSAGKHRIRVTYVGRNGQPRIAAPEQVVTFPKGRSGPVATSETVQSKTDQAQVNPIQASSMPPEIQSEIGSLRSSDPNLRGRGAFLLGEMKEKAAPAIPMLVSLLGDDKQSDFEANGNMHNSHVYDEAATALGKIGVQAIEPLIAKLAEVGSASDKAADALAHIGKPAVAALTTALKDDNDRVRAKAAGVLARTGGMGLENLLQALNDKDQDQGTRAAVAEGLRWTQDARATKALIDLLNDENSKVRACAASALGRAGNKAAVGPLIGRLDDKDMQVRVNATHALGKIGDKAAVASLLAITRGEKEGYRDGAFQALRMIGDPDSAEAVAKLIEASDPEARLESLRTLGDLNHPLAFEAPQSAKPVTDLLLNKKEDPAVRSAAAGTLRLYRDPYVMDALEKVLKDGTESEDLRSQAAKSLGRLGTPGIERLMNLEQSNDVELKRLATTGLKEILVTSSYPDARYTLSWEVYMDALREVAGSLASPAELDALARGLELPRAAAAKHPNPHIRSVAPLAERIADEEWDLHPLLRRLGKPNHPDSYPWGEAVNRVQCRLRMRQLDFWEGNRFGGEKLWTGDDAPQIKMDVRNQGTRDLNCSVPPLQLRLEVDGLEYGRPKTETPGTQIPLWPGLQRNAYRVALDKEWLREEKPLQMEPGKHTVRVVVQLNPTAGGSFAVHSNPIEVKIFPSGKERHELQNLKIEAGFVPDRNEIQAGEELGVEFYVRNVGDAAFGLRVGGDGRGVRPTRFKISAVDADGNKVTDPNANASNFGGFVGCPMIEPGKSYAESLLLSKWCEFVKPGVYTVTCTSVLKISKEGTSDLNEGKMLNLPIESRFSLTVKEPAAEQARDKVESMLKNRDKADFSILRSPVYLPVLREYAAREDGDAVKGIGSIHSPEATKALIALAEDWLKQGRKDLALQAIRALRSRLPDPRYDPSDQSASSGDEYGVLNRARVERTWRAEFAEPMRGMARRLVRNSDQESLETAGYILECVGTAEDLPDLMIGYTNAIEATKTLPFETHQYFRPRGASYRYRFAARQLVGRGGAVPEKPNTPGEAATYLIAMQEKKDFRPADWPQRVLRWLDYATPYMREFVLDFMPEPIPDAALDRIPALLADPYVDLQIAACHTAQKHPRETFREPLLAILNKGTEQYLLNAAAAAAPANGIPTDRIMEIWVRRMDRNDLGTKAVIRLLLAILDNNQRGDPQELSAEATAAAQARWRRFIEVNREKLRQGKRFKIGDPEITPDLFPPGFYWNKDNKPWPPQNDPSSASVTGTKAAPPGVATSETLQSKAAPRLRYEVVANKAEIPLAGGAFVTAQLTNEGSEPVTVYWGDYAFDDQYFFHVTRPDGTDMKPSPALGRLTPPLDALNAAHFQAVAPGGALKYEMVLAPLQAKNCQRFFFRDPGDYLVQASFAAIAYESTGTANEGQAKLRETWRGTIKSSPFHIKVSETPDEAHAGQFGSITIKGRVTDRSGKPVEGAAVEVSGAIPEAGSGPGFGSGMPSPTSLDCRYTDKEGSFVLPRLPDATAQFQIMGTHPAHAAAKATVVNVPPKKEYASDLTLERGVMIRGKEAGSGNRTITLKNMGNLSFGGRAVFADGSAVANADLYFYLKEEGSPRRMKTDAEGRFRGELRGRGPYSGSAWIVDSRHESIERGSRFLSSPHRWRAGVQNVAPGQETIELVFENRGRLEVSLAPGKKKPVAGKFEISCRYSYPGEQWPGVYQEAIACVVLPAEGGMALFEKLAPGQYEIRVIDPQGPSWEKWAKTVTLLDGKLDAKISVDLDAEAKQAGGLKARLVPPSGQNLPAAVQTGMRVPSGDWIKLEVRDGLIEAGTLPAGESALNIRCDGFLPVDRAAVIRAGEATDLGEIALVSVDTVAGWVEGRVLYDDGTPALGATVEGETHAPLQVSADGSYRQQRHAGHAMVGVQLAGAARWPRSAMPTGGVFIDGGPQNLARLWDDTIFAPVEVKAGETVHRDITIPLTEFGKVRVEWLGDRNTKNGSYTLIVRRGDCFFACESPNSGAAISQLTKDPIENVPCGERTVILRTMDYCGYQEAKPGEKDSVFRFDPAQAGSITGKLPPRAGAGEQRVELEVYHGLFLDMGCFRTPSGDRFIRQDGTVGFSKVGADGSFRFPKVGPGKYLARIFGDDSDRRIAVEVKPGAERVGDFTAAPKASDPPASQTTAASPDSGEWSKETAGLVFRVTFQKPEMFPDKDLVVALEMKNVSKDDIWVRDPKRMDKAEQSLTFRPFLLVDGQKTSLSPGYSLLPIWRPSQYSCIAPGETLSGTVGFPVEVHFPKGGRSPLTAGQHQVVFEVLMGRPQTSWPSAAERWPGDWWKPNDPILAKLWGHDLSSAIWPLIGPVEVRVVERPLEWHVDQMCKGIFNYSEAILPRLPNLPKERRIELLERMKQHEKGGEPAHVYKTMAASGMPEANDYLVALGREAAKTVVLRNFNAVYYALRSVLDPLSDHPQSRDLAFYREIAGNPRATAQTDDIQLLVLKALATLYEPEDRDLLRGFLALQDRADQIRGSIARGLGRSNRIEAFAFLGEMARLAASEEGGKPDLRSIEIIFDSGFRPLTRSLSDRGALNPEEFLKAGGLRALDPVIGVIDRLDASVRKETPETLKMLTGRDYGEDWGKWKEWLAARLRQEGEAAGKDPVSSGSLTNPFPDNTAWGEAVEGLQVRLRAEKGVWGVGEIPRLKMDVRNVGSRTWAVFDDVYAQYDWQIDGRWYRHPPFINLSGSPLGPGSQYTNLVISLDSTLREFEGATYKEPPSFSEGRHTIRAVLRPEGQAPEAMRVFSNPVEIEIQGNDRAKESAEREAKVKELAEREAKLKAGVAQESPEETVRNLLYRTYMIAAFAIRSPSVPNNAAMKRAMDSDPRVAKIIRIAEGGTDEEKGRVSTTLQEMIRVYIGLPSYAEEGQPWKPSVLSVGGALAYPYLLTYFRSDPETALELLVRMHLRFRQAVLEHRKQELARRSQDGKTTATLLLGPSGMSGSDFGEVLSYACDHFLTQLQNDESAQKRLTPRQQEILARCASLSSKERADQYVILPLVTELAQAGGWTDAATTRTLSEAPWGEAVEGIQVRLRAEKRVWQAEETPVFKADMVNRGNRKILVSRDYHNNWGVEIDGQLFRSAFRTTSLPVPFGPGDLLKDVEIRLESSWQGKPVWIASRRGEPPLGDAAQPLHLNEGKHKVRARHLMVYDEAGEKKAIRPVSNPVEIEVLRAGEAKPVPQPTKTVGSPLSSKAENKTDAVFKGVFALDKDIPVSLQWDTAEQKRLVRIETLRFAVKEFRAGAFVIREIHALIPVHYLSGPKAEWNVRVLLFDEKENVLKVVQETMANSGTIIGTAYPEKKDLDIRLTGAEPARVARFEIRITDASSSSAAAFGSGVPSSVDAHTSESAKAKPGEISQKPQEPPYARRMPFDGVRGYLEVPDHDRLDIGDAFTVEAWVKIHEARGECSILSKEVPWKTGWTLIAMPVGAVIEGGLVQEKISEVGSATRKQNDPQLYTFTFAVGDGTRFHNLTVPIWEMKYAWPRIAKDEWRHVAATWNKGKAAVYVDGEMTCQQTFEKAAAARVPLRIGKGSADLGRHFNGELSDIRIWSVARTEQQIRDDMRTPAARMLLGLAACWPLDDEVLKTGMARDISVHTGTLNAYPFSLPLEPAFRKTQSIEWGEPVDGVRLRLRPNKTVWSIGENPMFQLDIRSDRERVLPHYGPPLDDFDVRLDGVWYRRNKSGEREEGLRSVAPSPATERALHTRIDPRNWAREDSDTTMTAWSDGVYTFQIGFVVSPASGPNGKPLRAVSNPVEIRIMDSSTRRLPAGLEFLAQIPELGALRLDMTEDDLKAILEKENLRATVSESERTKGERNYHVFAGNGENVIVMFREGKCSGIQRMQPLRQTTVDPGRGEAAEDLLVRVRMEGDFAVGRELGVGLGGGVYHNRNVLSLQTIRFDEKDGRMKAILKGSMLSWPKGKWVVSVALLDADGKALDEQRATFENLGVIAGVPAVKDVQHEFDFGPAEKLRQSAKVFRVTLEGQAGPGIAWGGADNREIGIGLAYEFPQRPFKLGERIGFCLFVRNKSRDVRRLEDCFPGFPMAGYCPTVLDAQGNRIMAGIPAIDRAVQSRTIELQPGETFRLGTLSFLVVSPYSEESRVQENTCRLPPGQYQLFQEYRFDGIDGKATDGTDKSTLRSGALPLTVAKALPAPSP